MRSAGVQLRRHDVGAKHVVHVDRSLNWLCAVSPNDITGTQLCIRDLLASMWPNGNIICAAMGCFRGKFLLTFGHTGRMIAAWYYEDRAP